MSRTAALALFLFAVAAAPAAAAERKFGVSGFDRVRVDGPYRVTIATGVPPYARASGSTTALERVVIEVQGRTLIVRPNRSGWGGYPGTSPGPVDITIGTHELNGAILNGAGSLAVDRLKGFAFDLAVQGSGSASVGAVAVDQLKLALNGSGSASLGGSALKLTAVVRGVSTLDGGAMTVRDAVIGAEGPATVRLTVSETAKIDAQGAAAVQLAGKPACTVRAAGSATVSGCK